MPTAQTTDVREWLRAQGEDVKERGAIPAGLRAKYDEAHQGGGPSTVPGVVVDSFDLGPAFDPAVTEADFPEADDMDGGPPEGGGAAKPGKVRERRPRTVKGAAKGGIRERIFGGARPGAGKKAGPRQPRVSLSDWAEETWTDLAWLAQPLPPLAKILTVQAPYAGVVFDEQVRGTVIDITTDGADEHIDALAKKYLGVDSYPMRQEGEVRIKVRVRTDHIAMQG